MELRLYEFGGAFLKRLDEDLMVKAHNEFHRFWGYVRKFREVLEV